MRKKTARIYKALLCIPFLLLLSGICGCLATTEKTPHKQEEILPDSDTGTGDDSDADAFIDEIKERGYLLAGCKTDVPGLSCYEEQTDTWSGLEVELAYQTAANLFQVSVDEAKERQLVHFVGVTVADREQKLEQKEEIYFTPMQLSFIKKKQTVCLPLIRLQRNGSRSLRFPTVIIPIISVLW